MNVTYITVGNIQIPNLVLDPAPDTPIGKYGRMRKRFLEQRHDGTLTALVLSGKLTDHLLEIDRVAREQIEALRDRTFPPAFAVIKLRFNELRLGFASQASPSAFPPQPLLSAALSLRFALRQACMHKAASSASANMQSVFS